MARLVSVGNYRLDHFLLGEGAFGRVELATHTLLDSKVALKIIDKHKADANDYTRKNLMREGSILGRLHHPNIIRLLEIVSVDNLVCFALEYLPSTRALNEVLAESGGGGHLTEDQTRRLAAQLGSALCYLHAGGVVHRDLKLDNILVNKHCTKCCLVDFGLSAVRQGGELMNTHCGSVEYAAPELFTGDKYYGPPTDLWSLGIVLYAMLFGHLPFPLRPSSPASKDIVAGLSREHFTEMSCGLSAEGCFALLRCLEVDPGDRVTAAELVEIPWLSHFSVSPSAQSQNAWPDESDLAEGVAQTMVDQLGLAVSAPALLAHVRRRPFCSTGGCFNLLLSRRLRRARSEPFARPAPTRLAPREPPPLPSGPTPAVRDPRERGSDGAPGTVKMRLRRWMR